jgi:hypothetical protein
LAALGIFASSEFLAGDLKQMEPAVLAATLAVWTDDIASWEDASYWRNKIASHLIAWISRPVDDCSFIDGDGRESDCRYGVFRILGELKTREAIVAIEDYISKTERPIEAVVQAAGAHWCITASERFAPILEDAVSSYASIDAKHWLEEIRLAKLPRIIVTEHTTENGIETVKGVFARDEYFNFLVYLDEAPSHKTYRQTRIVEMYISAGEVTQWSWHDLNPADPAWRYGRILFSDLMTGLKEVI